MSLPAPKVGQVLRYSFLWSRQAHNDREEGAKDRPAAIVVCTMKDDGDTVVWVSPITHHPQDNDVTIEISPQVRKQLGLDDEPQWLVANEINRFTWPGFDLRRIPGQNGFVYGMLPKALYEELRATVQRLIKRKSLQAPSRD